jgi:signal transduction histidine kinase
MSMQLVEGSTLRYLKSFARFLLSLPATLRLWIVVLCTFGAQMLFFLLVPLGQNPIILAIPIVVAAWFYRKRGMLLCLAVMMTLTGIFYAVTMPYSFSNRFFMNFTIGVLVLLVVGLFISIQRDSFERAEESKRQMAREYNEEIQLHQAKHQFIQNVNHELKTPLTTLSACLELLQHQNEVLDVEGRASLLQNAASSCEELQILVNNILECLQVSDKQAPSLQPRETQLASIIQEIVRQADPRWQLSERTRLEIAEDLLVIAHLQYLRQLLRNLLSNAVKYAPSHVPILISARRTNNSTTLQPEICVSIKDWGPGIPADELPQLFGQFVRLSRDTLGEVRGSGLGLYISKHLVEAMGGRIWVESSGVPGEGSCFSFTLPVAPTPAGLSFVAMSSLSGAAVAISQGF